MKGQLILSVTVINTVIAGRSPLPVGLASVATSAVNWGTRIVLLWRPATQVGVSEPYHIHTMRAYSPK
jgi:hypothetical protein